LHYQCQPYIPWRGGRRLVRNATERWLVVEQNGDAQSSTGVWLFSGSGGAHRIVWQMGPTATLLITTSLVTKQNICHKGGSE
jgi:hypothetical protein